MSEITTIARPYARAVFDLASETGTVDEWSDMLAFMAAVVSDTTMRSVLDSPRMGGVDAAELFISVCEEHIDKQGRNFIRVLAENRRLPLLAEIATLYEHYRSEAEGKIEAQIISARALSDSQLDAMEKALKERFGSEVKVSNEIDPSLIGGAIIRAGDMVIDGSIRGKLNRLAVVLTR